MTENHPLGSNPLFTRREMLEMSSKAALADIAAGTVSHGAEDGLVWPVSSPIGLLRVHMRTGS
jgi:hypothetical protein